MEPDSAVCIKASGGDGYVSCRNTGLSKQMMGFEQALRNTVYFLSSTVVTVLVLYPEYFALPYGDIMSFCITRIIVIWWCFL